MRSNKVLAVLEKIREAYVLKTDMEQFKPDVVLQQMHEFPFRFYRWQGYGFCFDGELGHMVNGNITIPRYCGYCAADGDNQDEPDYILDNCELTDFHFSASWGEKYDTIGWSARCPACRAQTFQVIDTPHPYQYKPEPGLIHKNHYDHWKRSTTRNTTIA